MTTQYALTGGAWRLDPFTRVVRWVSTIPQTGLDAFDEPDDPGLTPEDGNDWIRHGTRDGITYHRRLSEPLCEACSAEKQQERRDRRQTAWLNHDPRYTCVCGDYKDRTSAHCRPCANEVRWGRVA